MTVLVTGGAGFIGSHFVGHLLASDADARIVCLDDFNAYYAPAAKRANVASFAANPRVTIVEGSITDVTLIRRVMNEHGVRRIVHLAAYAGVRSSGSMPLVYEETNVRGTLVLLEAARSELLESFVLVSSSTVYGAGAAVPFQEDAPLGVPLSLYGITKRSAELMGLHYQAVHGLPVVCLRPFSVYGPRIRPDLAMWIFADAILRERPIPILGDGSARRDFTHVSDICHGIHAAMVAVDVAGKAINLGHHAPIGMLELVRLLEAELGRPATIEWLPAFSGDLPITCADLTKAARLLDYHPRVSIEEGVADFARWFRQQNK